MAAGQSRGTTTSSNTMGVGLITAAAVVLILAGVMHAMQGVVGLATNEFYVVTQRWLFQFDVTTWGGVHIVIGLIGAATGVGLLYGASWARIVGVVVAAVSVIAIFLWLPYYPLWGVIIVAFDLFVIWAPIVSWQDIKNV